MMKLVESVCLLVTQIRKAIISLSVRVSSMEDRIKRLESLYERNKI